MHDGMKGRLGEMSMNGYTDGITEQFLTCLQESIGNAMFVSHQWMASNHPDPNDEQLKARRV